VASTERNAQRAASPPTRASSVRGSIAFPLDFDIFRPSVSSTRPFVRHVVYAGRSNSVVAITRSE
jgi:hypothetical protein